MLKSDKTDRRIKSIGKGKEHNTNGRNINWRAIWGREVDVGEFLRIKNSLYISISAKTISPKEKSLKAKL